MRPSLRLLPVGALTAVTACGGGGGGGGGGAPPPPPPVVVAVARPLVPAESTSFVVRGTDFPGKDGDAVAIRLVATDGLPLASCASDEMTVAATRTSSTSVGASLAPFALVRTVSATVTLDFGAGVVATSASPIATLVGEPDAAVDQDLDGVPDACDAKTYTFEGEALGARPAGTTALDGPGLPALAVVDRSGDRAVAFTGAGSPIAYERFDRVDADRLAQDTTIYADLDSTAGGSTNLELGNEGSYGGYAGGSIIFQVQPSGTMVAYERQANQILRSLAGPALPASGRVRLRCLHETGTTGSLRVDAFVAGAWQADVLRFDVADMRPYRGIAVGASNYFGGARAIRRLTVVRSIPDAPFTLAESPTRSMDWKVFQRGADGTAPIPIRVLHRLPTGGSAEVRIVRSATGETLPGFDFADRSFPIPRRPVGRTDFVVAGVPAGGNYDVQVRVRDAAGVVLGQQALLDVAVGDVYVAAGQSNMSGYSGNLIGVNAPTPLAHLFHNDGTWTQAREPMDDGDGQTDWISREYPASSCLLAFAGELSAATGVPVGIVPTSLGGTNLYAQWQRNAPFPASRITLYGSMLHRARLACPGTPARGILWFQGESDALAPRTTAQYAADLARFVSDARADLSAPDLVFLCGQLGTYDAASQPAWVGIQEAQRQVVVSDPRAALATAVDLPRADSIHFNVAGYRTLGQRFARGARRLVFGQAVDPTNDLVSVALDASATVATLTYERAVVGGAPTLYVATDATGTPTTNAVVASGATVTLTLSRPLASTARLSYGRANVATAAWVKDAADASPVPCFDGLVLTP